MISAYQAIHHRDTEKNTRILCVSVPLWFLELPGVANVHYVAVLHDVILAFEAECTLGAGIGF